MSASFGASQVGRALSQWLPEGRHSDLHIEHHKIADTGPFIPGAGLGVLWHITVSPWFAIDPMIRVLNTKHAEPQLIIGGRPGLSLPVVGQFLRLDHWGKALAHPAGTPETNKAGWVQIEICATVGNAHLTAAEGDAAVGEPWFHMPDVELPHDLVKAAARAHSSASPTEAFAAVAEDVHLCMEESHELAASFNSGVAAFSETQYRALANLRMWIMNRVAVPGKVARTTRNTRRFGAQEFIEVGGDCGHMHAPNNTHIDPTPGFKLKHVVSLSQASEPWDLL